MTLCKRFELRCALKFMDSVMCMCKPNVFPTLKPHHKTQNYSHANTSRTCCLLEPTTRPEDVTQARPKLSTD